MTQQNKCAVFDLDGTLIDTITDLGNACDYVLKKHGFIAEWTQEDYKHFVGNGMKKLIERAFCHTLDEDTLCEYLSEFKAYYNRIIFEHTVPYKGIPEQLAILKEKGIRLAVVTNKAEESAIIILKHFFEENTFDMITGQRDGIPVKPNPHSVLKTVEFLGCKPSETLYFGDSDVDMITAKNAHIRSVGVTWGFRGYEELNACHPYRIINTPEEISSLF